MKILTITLLPLLLFAQSYGLKAFINHTNKSNALIRAKEMSALSKEQEIQATKSDYWPTVDIGASYSINTPKSLFSPGGVGNVYIAANATLYDGGKREALLRAKIFAHKASLFEKRAFAKSVTLKVVRYYYGIQTLKATLGALKQRSRELKAQIERMRQFKNSGLATKEDIDRLQAAFENNKYTIADTKLSLESNRENLHLASGLLAKRIKASFFKEPKGIHFRPLETIRAMLANASAIGENANAVAANYKPQVTISDSLSKSYSHDYVTLPGLAVKGLMSDHQNKLSLSVHMRVFDNGKISKEAQAIKYNKLALLAQIAHAKKEQLMHFKLAKRSLHTSQTKIQSAKSALKAAKSTYTVVKEKFEAGLVDNVTFLDALSQKTAAIAQYKAARFEYEVAKSIYYYYAGADIKEFIQ